MVLFLDLLIFFKQVNCLIFHQYKKFNKNKKIEMKFATLALAGSATADENNVLSPHPLQRLTRLVQFSAEILDSGAFNIKSDKWIQRWTDKFSKNANRMKKNFTRGNQRCGYYDEK